MNWVDGAIVVIVAYYALLGAKRGFLAVASELVALLAGLGAAYLLFRPAGALLATQSGLAGGLAQLAAFLVIWFVVQLVVGLALSLWVRRVPKETRKGWANRLGGILPSLLKGLVTAALLATFLSVQKGQAARDARRSVLARPMVRLVERYERPVYNTFAEAFGDLGQLFGKNPEVEGFKRLPFHTNDFTPDPQAEAEMLRLLNGERVRRGLVPLVSDPVLRQVARRHSADMLRRGYFAHVSPDGKSPFDRMRAAGVKYRMAGENLAFAMTVEVAQDGLMHSPGHRKNILMPGYRRVGIGAMRAGLRGTMFTQDFTN